MSNFSPAELAYLEDQTLGRLATINQDGAPQVSPVGFSHNEGLDTIDISGFNMSRSAKYRNVAHNDRVAFVIDDLASTDPWRVRCLEIRGVAEAIADPGEPKPGQDKSLIRIHPKRIISFGIEHPDQAPHEMTTSNRDVA
jgi:pyridoxamine 5'-phosphate oxidase family protein